MVCDCNSQRRAVSFLKSRLWGNITQSSRMSARFSNCTAALANLWCQKAFRNSPLLSIMQQFWERVENSLRYDSCILQMPQVQLSVCQIEYFCHVIILSVYQWQLSQWAQKPFFPDAHIHKANLVSGLKIFRGNIELEESRLSTLKCKDVSFILSS